MGVLSICNILLIDNKTWNTCKNMIIFLITVENISHPANIFSMDIQWSMNVSDLAKTTYSFISVSPLDFDPVNISNALKIWSIYPDILFHTGYRIVGSPDDISVALSNSNISPLDIQEVLLTSISFSNYNTDMSSVYHDELHSYLSRSRSIIYSNINSPGAKLYDVMSAINPDLTLSSKSSRVSKRKTKSLYDRLISLPPGKVLDVSSLTLDGFGTKAINPPLRAKKYGTSDLPIVSSDFSHYIMAINMLPGGLSHYASQVESVEYMFSAQPSDQLPLPLPIPSPIRIPSHIAFPSNPMLEPTEIPQPDPVTPTRVYPIFSKGERNTVKKNKELALLSGLISAEIIDDDDAYQYSDDDESPISVPPIVAPSPIVPPIVALSPIVPPIVPRSPIVPPIVGRSLAPPILPPTVPRSPSVRGTIVPPTIPRSPIIRGPILPPMVPRSPSVRVLADGIKK